MDLKVSDQETPEETGIVEVEGFSESSATEGDFKCEKHQEDILMWCNKCKDFICLTCLPYHNGHTLIAVEKSSEIIKTDFKNFTSEMVHDSKLVQKRFNDMMYYPQEKMEMEEKYIKEHQQQIVTWKSKIFDSEKQIIVRKKEKNRLERMKRGFYEKKVPMIEFESQVKAINHACTTGGSDSIISTAIKAMKMKKEFETMKQAFDQSWTDHWQKVEEELKNDLKCTVRIFSGSCKKE